VLLTILGEFVLPAGGPVWQETLVAALAALGYKTQTARQAVARSVSAGWLTTERHGRRARLQLTAETADMLNSGAERIYSFGEPRDWNGHWLVVALRVPESRRDVRHLARTRLAWEGFGSLGGGLWISPHAEREAELASIVDAGSTGELLTFRAEIAAINDPRKLVAEAWDLKAVADAYRAFLRRFTRRCPLDVAATFRAQTQLVHEWRKFPFLDPDLPESLLPGHWPRRHAHDLFRSRHNAWHLHAQAHFRVLERGDAGVVYGP
jgi:phenylacetic acid degradation operon negative regulatory protein